jgi:membrane protease YdiL (CAAX protease family)
MHLPGNLLWRGLIMVKNWFINSDDLRLRAGWRIAVFMLLLMALAVAGQMGVRALLGGLPRTSTLVLVIIATAATLAVLIARRYLDRKSFVSFGFNDVRSGSLDMLFGFALSGAMAGLVLWLMVAFGHVTNVQIQWAGLSTALLLLAALLPNLLVGYWEELVFRGYLLQNMREGLGLKIAIIVSCILYGIVHAANPNATMLSSAIIVLFGFLRIYGYLATGMLWLSIGMHTGWNYFQSTVFGFAASGHVEKETLFTHDATAVDWLSGGAFGPEGSLLIIPVLLLALLAMRAWSTRHRSRGLLVTA